MARVKSALHLKDAQLFLDDCARRHGQVSMTVLKLDGTVVRYEGWVVLSSWWRKGTHDLRNPVSGQVRKVIDVLIFDINGHPVYI